MNYEQSWIERRGHQRVNARGPAILRGRGRVVHGRAVTVSDTALEVSCQLGSMLLSLAGASVEIEMRLDDEPGGWFILHGQVARLRAASHSVVIAMAALPEPLAAIIAKRARDDLDTRRYAGYLRCLAARARSVRRLTGAGVSLIVRFGLGKKDPPE